MTTQKQEHLLAPAQAVVLMQKAINLNKQAAALTQKAVILTQQANTLLASGISGSQRQSAVSASPAKQEPNQSQKKHKQTPITKEASARIQSAADRNNGRESSLNSEYFRQRFSCWDDDDDD